MAQLIHAYCTYTRIVPYFRLQSKKMFWNVYDHSEGICLQLLKLKIYLLGVMTGSCNVMGKDAYANCYVIVPICFNTESEMCPVSHSCPYFCCPGCIKITDLLFTIMVLLLSAVRLG